MNKVPRTWHSQKSRYTCTCEPDSCHEITGVKHTPCEFTEKQVRIFLVSGTHRKAGTHYNVSQAAVIERKRAN
jgi:hypothetical protein